MYILLTICNLVTLLCILEAFLDLRANQQVGHNGMVRFIAISDARRDFFRFGALIVLTLVVMNYSLSRQVYWAIVTVLLSMGVNSSLDLLVRKVIRSRMQAP